jgi:hypothetical protein
VNSGNDHTTHVFVDEAGRSRPTGGSKNESQPYFIVGVLVTNDPDALVRAIADVRRAHRFDNEIHWSKQSNSRVNVYRAVANAVAEVQGWDYRATRFDARRVNLKYFGGSEHRAYNRFVRLAIETTLRTSPLVIGDRLAIQIDAKERVREDNFLDYLGRQLGAEVIRASPDYVVLREVEVSEVDSKRSELVQLCDLFSGAYHSYVCAPRSCGERKLQAAGDVWFATGRCRAWTPRLGN